MTKAAIEHINAALIASGLFNTNYGFASIIDEEGVGGKPIYYVSPGHALNIDYDTNGSFSYIRITGDPQKDFSNRFQTTSCAVDAYSVKIPVRIVCFKKKDDFSDCAGFESYNLLEKLQSSIDLSELVTEINANEAELRPRKEIHDPATLLKQEYPQRDMKILLEWVYCAIDFSLEIDINKDCLNACTSQY